MRPEVIVTRDHRETPGAAREQRPHERSIAVPNGTLGRRLTAALGLPIDQEVLHGYDRRGIR